MASGERGGKAASGERRRPARALAYVAALLMGASADVASAADPSAAYHFYNDRTGTHFLTISAAERDATADVGFMT